MEWVIKSDYIGSAFFDASASAFILPQLQLRAERSASGSETSAVPASGAQASAADKTPTVASAVGGAALGPEWVAKTAVKHFLNEKRDLLMAGNLQVGVQPVQSVFILSRLCFIVSPSYWIILDTQAARNSRR